LVGKKAMVDAQTAANNNKVAASALADNPQDKLLTRKADNAAPLAQMNANSASKAGGDVSNLQKEIQLLKDKLADDATKAGNEFRNTKHYYKPRYL
jgi:hypothetical protein